MLIFRYIFPMLSLLALTLSLSHGSMAQFTARIQGTVTDQKGAVVGGAKVIATNQATNVNHEAVASDTGFYRVEGLPPGKYTITINAPGFKESITHDLNVEAESPRGLDVQLTVGAVSEQVTVTAGTAMLQTEDASLAATITNQQLERLPIFGRDPYELLRITPGIAGDGARSGSGQSVFFFSSRRRHTRSLCDWSSDVCSSD